MGRAKYCHSDSDGNKSAVYSKMKNKRFGADTASMLQILFSVLPLPNDQTTFFFTLITQQYAKCVIKLKYRLSQKKVFHKSEEKMQEKRKMA